MKFFKTIWIFIFSLFILCNCQKEKRQIIPEEVEEYVEEFFNQANYRGIQINLSDYNLEINFTEIEERASGLCYNRRKHLIELDSEIWEIADTEFRERLIFHELGHCILDRDHRNEKSVIGDCFSIMRGGHYDNFSCNYNLYSKIWREQYLDELFDIKDVDLINDIKNYNYNPEEVFNNTISLDTFTDNKIEVDLNVLMNLDAYDIRLIFMDWKAEQIVGMNFQDVVINVCDCQISKINIRSSKDHRQSFYSSRDIEISLSDDTKIGLAKRNGKFYFFIDEILYHIFESELIEDFTSDMILTTYNADDPIRVKMEVLY